MKKTILCALAAAALALPASAADLSVFGSYWDTKDADNALGIGSRLRFGIVELRGTYFTDVTADTEPERFDFEVSAIPLEAGLAFKFAEDSAFSPYVGGGIGYYMLDTTEGDIDDEVGWYAVVGGEFAQTASGLGFMAEAMYRGMEATVDRRGNNNIRDEVAFDLGGLGVNAGIVWRFD